MKNIIFSLRFSFGSFCLVISYLYALKNNSFAVGDGYYQQAQVFYYLIFGGTSPSTAAFQIFAQRGFLFRPLYPLISALLEALLNIFISQLLSLFVSMIVLSITCGFLTIILFGKLIAFLTNSEVSEKMGRLLLGSTPTFILFWIKYSCTDIVFLLPFTIALYYLFKYEKEPEKLKNLMLFALMTIITCFVREDAILLFFAGIAVFFRSNRKLAYIFIIGGFDPCYSCIFYNFLEILSELNLFICHVLRICVSWQCSKFSI